MRAEATCRREKVYVATQQEGLIYRLEPNHKEFPMPTSSKPEDDTLEQRIRDRAHDLWVQEGYPQGRDLIHWEMARASIASETTPAKPKAPRKAAAKPKTNLQAVR